jgi:DNA polymerase-3 subunit alpha
MSKEKKIEEKFAIRFGLGAVKAVGFNVMKMAVDERCANGDFKDIYDFASRLEAKSINKKSIEALSKAGAFDSIAKNRRQIAESFEILSNYANQQKEEALSNQMNLFGSIADSKPSLVNCEEWEKSEKLQKEFEAFGFFLNQHPLDDKLSDLRKRGVVFSNKIERDEFEDGNLVKMAGVVASSKHRSSAKGRFAYLNISDPFGIFEAMIFDEAIITNARDILVDGSEILIEALVRKDDGGLRILVREVRKLEDFIRDVKAQSKDFEDIKKQIMRSRPKFEEKKEEKKEELIFVKEKENVLEELIISINNRDEIFRLKSFLANKIAVSDESKITKIMLKSQNQTVALPDKYAVSQSEFRQFCGNN